MDLPCQQNSVLGTQLLRTAVLEAHDERSCWHATICVELPRPMNGARICAGTAKTRVGSRRQEGRRNRCRHGQNCIGPLTAERGAGSVLTRRTGAPNLCGACAELEGSGSALARKVRSRDARRAARPAVRLEQNEAGTSWRGLAATVEVGHHSQSR